MILVTGGTGLVGSQILFDLTSQGKKVRALKRASSDTSLTFRLFKNSPQQFELIEWVNGDVNDIFSLEDAMENVDVIYHCAAMISFHPEDRARMHKVNAEGTANMVNVAMDKGVKQFCHVSSVAALGRNEANRTISETNAWKTSKFNSNYAISKYSGEREVWRAIEEGLNAFIINPSIIIGPGNWKTGSTQLFPSIYNGLPFYSSGINGYVDVRDVSRCAIKLMEKNISGQRFILSTENISYKELFFMIADVLGKKRPYIEAKPWMTRLVWPASKILSLLTGKKSMITKETALSGIEKWSYSNAKIKSVLQEDFYSIKEAIEYTGKIFLAEKTT